MTNCALFAFCVNSQQFTILPRNVFIKISVTISSVKIFNLGHDREQRDTLISKFKCDISECMQVKLHIHPK